MTSFFGVDGSQCFGETGCYLLQNMGGGKDMQFFAHYITSDVIDVNSLRRV